VYHDWQFKSAISKSIEVLSITYSSAAYVNEKNDLEIEFELANNADNVTFLAVKFP